MSFKAYSIGSCDFRSDFQIVAAFSLQISLPDVFNKEPEIGKHILKQYSFGELEWISINENNLTSP